MKTKEKPEEPLPIKHPRAGWEVQFALITENGDDQLSEELLFSDWDDEEWIW
ncbi:MAG: hypothetical protein Q7U53_00720 [Anaerolineaceae bacterium]|nr:hypothetical protein [Anaerolineaceae bacterium]